MSLTFLHTADWQIGKPYARILDEQKRVLARQERLQAIQRLGAVAHERHAQFIIVAGDLFDSTTPDKATVSAACAAMGALKVPVFVIPGNHDHGGPGSLWEQTFFLQECAALAPNLRVLLKPEPVELEHAVLLPCPLLRRHDSSDTTAWLRSVDTHGFGDKPRIVIAHGSVQDFGPVADDEEDFASSNHLDLSRLPGGEFDYIALGDWHGMKDVSVTTGGKLPAWYSGTPEPDRFPRGVGNTPGHVLVVSLGRNQPALIEPVKTARLGWHELEFHFTEDEAVSRLDEALNGMFQGRTGQDLLRLTLSGSLGIAAWARLDLCLETWRSRLLRLRLHSSVTTAPTEAEMSALVSRTDAPLTARVAERLLQETLSPDAEVSETARQGLRVLFGALNGTA
ncbi:DNA repair exonuclease SbcCD nuclease subunit [Prosthecobacter fusiformis]|uniref:DNA repair exonuclease SbcCD nuclease subunit n=1 Tax=Prosthecobacter fusiformis TaxID=48464 RepID=A0A4R7SQ93_9BACT|nr:DNA repair exonuclease [Prosthecobacter fusiformis]TDU81181.1 DNA repair exonuclease SbcCD nuclease subunit [Prosthecobacter fusiformis]